MGNVISIDEYRSPWREVFSSDGETTSIQLYMNSRTGEVEIVQTNDDGESIRTVLTSLDASLLRSALTLISKKVDNEK